MNQFLIFFINDNFFLALYAVPGARIHAAVVAVVLTIASHRILRAPGESGLQTENVQCIIIFPSP